MKRITLFALAWAIAILGVAIVGTLDLIPQDSARTLVLVMPALALASLGSASGKTGCGVRA